jgi:hypothetical protein
LKTDLFITYVMDYINPVANPVLAVAYMAAAVGTHGCFPFLAYADVQILLRGTKHLITTNEVFPYCEAA